MKLRKYPRTPHLPWSPGVSPDDERVADVSRFVGRRVVVTEKLDGECTTIYAGGCHARSLDTAYHESRSRVRALAGGIGHSLGEWQIVGENVAAVHSIRYERLPSHFLAFAIHDSRMFASWDVATRYSFEPYGLRYVPVLYDGLWDEAAVRACYTGKSAYGGEQEGYVVRVADWFRFEDFGSCVAKYVRADHVQTDEHWLRRPVEWQSFSDGNYPSDE